jgi:hypothetical protein
MRENFKKAEEHRRLIDEAYHRQLIENEGNAGIQGPPTGNSDKDITGTKPEIMGVTLEENDDNRGENLAG